MSLAPLGRSKDVRWKISSKLDPRWNGTGEGPGFISMSPREADDHLKKCRRKYGKQPKDLFYEAHVVYN